MPVAQLLPSDIPAVLRIEKKSFIQPWTQEMYAAVCNDSYMKGIKWTEGGEIRGYLVYGLFPPTLEVMNVVTHPDHLREGIGRRMMAWVIDEARSKSCTESFLEVRISNTPAIKLYESFRFTVVHTRKQYYRNGEDAYVMGAQL